MVSWTRPGDDTRTFRPGGEAGSSDEYVDLMSAKSARPLHDVIHRRFSAYLWGARFHSAGRRNRHNYGKKILVGPSIDVGLCCHCASVLSC